MTLRKTLPCLVWIAALSGTAAGADGSTIYAQQCAACHGLQGEGIAGLAPTLKDSPFVKSSSVEDIAAVIRAGRAGDSKLHPNFPSMMPPFPNLSDAEVTALAEFLKGGMQQ